MLSIPTLTQIITVLVVALALTAAVVAGLATWLDGARAGSRRPARTSPGPVTVPAQRTAAERLGATR